MKLLLLVVLAACPVDGVFTVANPIRKVVNMLQMMQKKVEAEGVREKELYEKFQCYCKNGAGDLQKSIGSANTKIPETASDIEEGKSKKIQLEADLKRHQADRSAAKKAMAEATSIREKEAAEFAKVKADGDKNVAAMAKAIAALEKGMGGFLQTNAAQVVMKIVSQQQGGITDYDRQAVLSFLSGQQTSDYAPQSGEITGILKEMLDSMSADLAEAIATEEASIKSYDGLMSAKTKEVHALTAAIETKTQRVGELAVAIVQMENDLSETEAALLADQEFLANLDKDCESKKGEYEARVKTRAEELVALADTIKILNDDDALELFKKTLPSPGASFVQMKETAAAMKSRVQVVLQGARKNCKTNCQQLDFISLALRGQKISFEKVIKMIDDMVALLHEEQKDDDNKKEYCGVQFDHLDDKKKGLERLKSDLETTMAEAEDGISTLTADIKALEAGIVALDKSVAEATEQRKEEHMEFNELVASDTAAKELLHFAKNRLNQFYNPKLYKPPAKRELSAQNRVYENLGGDVPQEAAGGIAGTGVTALLQTNRKDAPAPPPETWDAYNKKGEEATGVIGMIDLLVADLDKELTEARTEEKDSQADYEQLMKESAGKRGSDSKLLSEKGGTKADLASQLQSHKEEHTSTGKELMATLQVIQSLHAECDWLVQYFDVRKEARSGEIDALKKAKAVLSGADYSL